MNPHRVPENWEITEKSVVIQDDEVNDWGEEKIIDPEHVSTILSCYIRLCLDDYTENVLNRELKLEKVKDCDTVQKGKWFNVYMKKKVNNIDPEVRRTLTNKMLANFRNTLQSKVNGRIRKLKKLTIRNLRRQKNKKHPDEEFVRLLDAIGLRYQPAYHLLLNRYMPNNSVNRFFNNFLFDINLLKLINDY